MESCGCVCVCVSMRRTIITEDTGQLNTLYLEVKMLRTAKERESWRILPEGYFRQWKDSLQ